MKLTRFALSHHQFTLVMSVLVVVLGLVSFLTMSRSEDPQFEFAAVAVTVVYPGADTVDLEAQVIDPLEAAIWELDDIDRLESTIEDGVANVSVQFLSGTDPDDAYDDVLGELNRVRAVFPQGVARVEARQFSPTDTNILQVALLSETASYRELQRRAEDLESRFERVPGVKRSEVWAFPRQEVRVSVDLERLRNRGLVLSQVIDALRASAQNLPGGHLELGGRRFNLQTSGDYASVEEIARTAIAANQGRLVYLEDVADVALDYADDTYRGSVDGGRAAFVTVVQRKGSNIFDVRERLGESLAELQAELPPDVEARVTFDQAESVAFRVDTFFDNLLQGVLLVGAVIFLALGPRASSIVVTLIPLSILIAVTWLDWTGFGLQQLSIVGLVIALGLLVDNAIVVTENTSRALEEGMAPLRAAYEGTRQVGWPVVSSTVTTVLSFLPIVFMPGGSGDFVRSMPITVIFALVASLLLSLTLTPYLSSRILERRPPEARGWPLQRLLRRLVDGPYGRLLAVSLRRPLVVLAVALLVFVASLGLFPLVGISFFPNAEKPQFVVDVTTPEGSSLERTETVTRRVAALLDDEPLVRYTVESFGRDNPQIYYNVIPRAEKTNRGQVLVELATRDLDETRALVERLRAKLDGEPGADFLIREFRNGPPIEAPIALKIIGPELDTATDLAADIEGLLRAAPGVTEIDNPLGTPKTDLQVVIDRDKAAMLGVPVIEIDRSVRAGLAGLPVATYRDAEGEELDVVVRLPLDARAPSLGDLDRISVASMRGGAVPLRQVATLEFASVPSRIDHFQLERAATVTADVAPGFSVPAVTARAVERARALDWPPGYRLFVGGEAEALGESFGGLGQALAVALLGIFGVLVLQFRSFAQPLIVFAAIPLAVVGAIGALLLTGYSFSFMAFVGLTSLVGIVVNNSIILVDFANQRRAEGVALADAAAEAARVRFVPIVLTTLTTVAGLLPLALTGSALWSPLSWAIIGGLVTSALLTLLVVPALYRLITPKRRGQRLDDSEPHSPPALHKAEAA